MQQIINPVIGALGLGGTAEGQNTIGRLLARVFSAGLAVGAIAFLLYLFYGAFRWLIAGDNKGQLEAARSTIFQALIGLTILASIFAIARIVGLILGLECEGQRFPDVICWPQVPTP